MRRSWSNSGTSICALLIALSGGGFVHAAEGLTAGVILLEAEGTVEYQRKGNPRWNPAPTNGSPNLPLDPGDTVRTKTNSRASLQMYDHSIFRMNETTMVTIKPPPGSGEKLGVTLWRGLLYIFSRDRPTEVNPQTPTATLAIRGTEFVLSYDDEERTAITVLDGEVDLRNAEGSITITNHEKGIAEPGKVPSKTPVI